LIPDPDDPETEAAAGFDVLAGTTAVLFDGDVGAAIGKAPDTAKDEEKAGAEEVFLGGEVSPLVVSAGVDSACEESGTDLDPETGF